MPFLFRCHYWLAIRRIWSPDWGRFSHIVIVSVKRSGIAALRAITAAIIGRYWGKWSLFSCPFCVGPASGRALIFVQAWRPGCAQALTFALLRISHGGGGGSSGARPRGSGNPFYISRGALLTR